MLEGEGIGAASDAATLRAVAYELKQPLIRIARQTELDDASELPSIRQNAEDALRLIDSFLLTAQSEYGQQSLNLEPLQAGAVLYDVSQQLKRQTSVAIDSRVHEAVMTHRSALASILAVFGDIIGDLSSHVVLRSYKTRNGAVGIGVFGATKLTRADLRQAMELQGNAHAPLGKINTQSKIPLSIAEGLCRAIGGTMTIKHMGTLSGLATELPRSEQLSLV